MGEAAVWPMATPRGFFCFPGFGATRARMGERSDERSGKWSLTAERMGERSGGQSGKRPADDRAEDGRQVPRCRRKKAPQSGGLRRLYGADDGNRTRVFGLGSGHSAIELHLRHFYRLYIIIQKNGSVKSNCAICAVPGQFFLQSHCKVTGMAGPAAPPERRRNSPAHRFRRCCVVFPGRPPAQQPRICFFDAVASGRSHASFSDDLVRLPPTAVRLPDCSAVVCLLSAQPFTRLSADHPLVVRWPSARSPLGVFCDLFPGKIKKLRKGLAICHGM